jgi:Protein of unknown function (DUF4257)
MTTLQPDTRTPEQEQRRTTRLEAISVFATSVLVGVAVAVAVWTSDYESPLEMIVFAFAVGAIGGLIHEFAQSGGKIMFFERKIDGMYLGTLAGGILGGVAGILAARGLQTETNMNVFYESFLAGMALKGIVEASTGAPLPPGQQDVTAPQAALAETLAKAGATSNSGQHEVVTRPPALTQPPKQLQLD